MKLRSIELALPDPAAAARFMLDIWGMAPGEVRGDTHYLRGSGSYPYLVAFEKADAEFVRSTTFVCTAAELADIRSRAAARGWPLIDTVSADPGAGEGVIVELPEGELLRFLVNTTEVEPITGRDLPVKLTHIVFNSADAEASGHAVEDVLGFRVSDRTKGMVFVRCNDSHHSTAFARAGFSSLNHIAFEMEDLDAVMRGIGRMRDHGFAPAWGPGRHGPGANVYAYYIAPFGPVIEYSTAVEKVPEDYQAGSPEDWTWPPNRIDQWGISDKDFDGLRQAEERFRFRRAWQPADPAQA
ncbi:MULTISPECIES: VOC family protein [unclassified Novosphingobium]|uniref:VOC family protein n=1 Tax=unclassified Novosphingobium TaxID=2644732 RepID=UPI00144186B8|nr:MULTISPECIES: VOC family protein [unclassified Novosphingobium]MBB3359100.1 catechol 2,3-dioxygenase-like lactoylglutathione lyase family enzyme [Novosphingobium sp. BK256]MBB3375419.1 catechol 2,3-dioxygenase-like lactoylglutathione lyase family enzyme [Novosphingobium sp. BK280]MBB3379872.1 catechol 2,3-dioxygenase-like lactoylglutathione lyase family enzyme [Novosphingobium sp. BK258]MBB3421567.1 catechol 2,3-dioxygenase-like lactoylglutathione lyase family enzyme [Novosphingobium sp. BK2